MKIEFTKHYFLYVREKGDFFLLFNAVDMDMIASKQLIENYLTYNTYCHILSIIGQL
jgi:hypothetical protein